MKFLSGLILIPGGQRLSSDSDVINECRLSYIAVPSDSLSLQATASLNFYTIYRFDNHDKQDTFL